MQTQPTHIEFLEQRVKQHHERLRSLVTLVPQQQPRQDSTLAQLMDLRVMANRMGMYDAADALRNVIERAQSKGA